MTISNLKTVLPAELHRVWDVVTDVRRYPDWRSDVERVEVPGAREFWEYTRGGYVTKFTITKEETGRRWELAMENDVDFTEYVTAKKLWMKPFVKLYLKRQQAQFAADLWAALETRRSA